MDVRRQLRANGARDKFIASVLTFGVISPQASPVSGQTAEQTYSESYCVCRMARGRVPNFAHAREIVPCWPKRASS